MGVVKDKAMELVIKQSIKKVKENNILYNKLINNRT